MLKILNGFSWLEEELGEDTKEIKECLKQGLIKYTYDESRANFMVLESNIDVVKEVLGDDYYKLNEESLMPWLNEELRDCGRELEIENAFSDKIIINSYEIYDLINDGEISFSNEEIMDMYNSGSPALEMGDIGSILGTEQAKIRIMDLLNNLDNYITHL
jgi:hypothetical protein